MICKVLLVHLYFRFREFAGPAVFMMTCKASLTINFVDLQSIVTYLYFEVGLEVF